MKTCKFRTAAIAVLGTSLGWQSKIARRLKVAPRTVRRWIAAGETPAWIDIIMAELMGLAGVGPWPRDEWIVGDAETAAGGYREYVIHLASPRFAARVVRVLIDERDEMSIASEEKPADILSGTVYMADGSDPNDSYIFAEVDWFDLPKAGEVTQLMEAAADALETSTVSAARARNNRHTRGH